MAGFWNLPNTFATLSGTLPASLLDDNFTALAIAPQYSSAVSGVNDILLTTPLTFVAYVAGMSFIFTATSNNTGGVTINVNALGVVTLVKNNNQALVANDVVAGGAYQIYYDGSNFHLLNPTVANVATENKIINPGMVIDQRTEGSGATLSTGDYMVDRWYGQFFSSAGVISWSRSVAVPTDAYANSLLTSVVTADNSIAASEYFVIAQRIEGYNIVDLIGKTFTIGFWVRSSLIGTYFVSLANSGATYSYCGSYTINVANTWEYKTITVIGGLTTLATWLKTNGIGCYLYFTLASGTTWHSTIANAWVAGNFLTTSAQVNWLGTAGNTFRLTGVQLCLGSILPQWESRQFGDELALCQRYYQKSYVTPGTVPGTATIAQRFIGVQGIAGTLVYNFNAVLPTPMRASPTVTLYNPNTGTSGSIRNGATNPTATATGQGQLNTGYVTLGTAGAVGDILGMHYTAEAEL